MNPPVVFVGNEQDDHPVDEARWLELAKNVLVAEKVGSDFEVNVLYVDEPYIADLNERFMGKEGPTDVLSFPIDETPAESGRSPDAGGNGPGSVPGDEDEEAQMLGDIVICPAVAARNAPDHAGSYDDECALLLVHGILHLLGMDHHEEDEALAMEARERELLTQFYKELRDETWSNNHS